MNNPYGEMLENLQVVDLRPYRFDKILKILGLPDMKLSKMTDKTHTALNDALDTVDVDMLVREMDLAGFDMSNFVKENTHPMLTELLTCPDKVAELEETILPPYLPNTLPLSDFCHPGDTIHSVRENLKAWAVSQREDDNE